MTKTEMLVKLIERAGWTITDETDEDGYRIAVAKDDAKN